MSLPPNDRTEGYGRGTTYFADIFADQAPLTDEQMLAQRAMLAMATEEFWEEAARENGITNMARSPRHDPLFSYRFVASSLAQQKPTLHHRSTE